MYFCLLLLHARVQLVVTPDVTPRAVLHRNVKPYVRDPCTGSCAFNPSFFQFPLDVPQAYISLAMQCVSTDTKARPTFTHIATRLEVGRMDGVWIVHIDRYPARGRKDGRGMDWGCFEQESSI